MRILLLNEVTEGDRRRPTRGTGCDRRGLRPTEGGRRRPTHATEGAFGRSLKALSAGRFLSPSIAFARSPSVIIVVVIIMGSRSSQRAEAYNALLNAWTGWAPRTLWPSGLRRWLKAPFRKGVGSNPTGVTLHVQVWVSIAKEQDLVFWKETPCFFGKRHLVFWNETPCVLERKRQRRCFL